MSEAGKGDCNDNKRPTLHTYRYVPFQDKTKEERKMKLWERLFAKSTATKNVISVERSSLWYGILIPGRRETAPNTGLQPAFLRCATQRG